MPPAEVRKLRGVAAWAGDTLKLTVYNGTSWRVTELYVRVGRFQNDDFVEDPRPLLLSPPGGQVDAGVADLIIVAPASAQFIAKTALDNLVTVCDFAAENGLGVDLTFFTGHMSGPNWCPSWLLGGDDHPYIGLKKEIVNKGKVVKEGYRNMFHDEMALNASRLLLKTVVSRLKDHPAILMWALGNEVELAASDADRIRVGEADVMIAGGAESMSLVPMGGNKPSFNPAVFARDENIGIAYGMGLTAEKVATQWKVSRAAQDAFALESHTRALAAMRSGDFSATGVTIYDPLTGNADGTGRTPFVNNTVPPARIDRGGRGQVSARRAS